MVCLKADAGRLSRIMEEAERRADFIDEDLDNMRTAVAVGPLDRETANRMLGDLSLA